MKIVKVSRTYDTVYKRLTNVNYADGTTVSYTYDLISGRKLTVTDNRGVTSYTYEAVTGRFATVTNPDSIFISYTYDAAGNRQTVTTPSGTTTGYYVYGNDLISQEKLGIKSYFHYDGHGSTRSLTSEVEEISGSYDYDGYGKLLTQSGILTNYMYTGEQYDPDLDQYYLRARYYNQNVGRFQNMDTWQGSLSNPTTLNKYIYGNANPVMYIDPSGHFGIGQSMAAISVATILATMPLVGCSDYVEKNEVWLTHLRALNNLNMLERELMSNVFPNKSRMLMGYFFDSSMIFEQDSQIEPLSMIIAYAYGKIRKGMSEMTRKDYITVNKQGWAMAANKKLPITIRNGWYSLPKTHRVNLSQDGAIIVLVP